MPIFNNVRMGASMAKEAPPPPTPEVNDLVKSLRFNKYDANDLEREFEAATNEKKWTLSFWVKRCDTIHDSYLFSAGGVSFIGFDGPYLVWSFEFNSTTYINKTSIEYNDCASWYHIVATVDSAAEIPAERMRLYVNGDLVSYVAGDFSDYTELPQNEHVGYFNQPGNHRINRRTTNGYQEEDFYLADMYFVDGHVRGPENFGENDANGIWQRKKYSGVFGNNGFHLFDYGNVPGIGQDSSGKGNDWTADGFTTVGDDADVFYDVPKNGNQTDNCNGGEVSANYATLNPNDIEDGVRDEDYTLHKGCLEFLGTKNPPVTARSTIWFDVEDTTGYYAEFQILPNEDLDVNSNWAVGIETDKKDLTKPRLEDTNTFSPALSENDIIGVFVRNGKVYFEVNGQAYNNSDPINQINPQFENLTGMYAFSVEVNKNMGFRCNFGARPFSYPPQIGFKTLNTKSISKASILDGSDYFDTKTYVPEPNVDKVISGLAFQPDLMWIKSTLDDTNEQEGGNHIITDYDLITKNEYIRPAHSQPALSDPSYFGGYHNYGYTLLSGQNDTTSPQHEYVAWNWDAGTTTVTNTNGTINSTVRANPTSGFSVVRYTGTEENASIGHGLGDVPAMIWVKNLSIYSNWPVYHKSLDDDNLLWLNLDVGQSSYPRDEFQQKVPDPSVFYVGPETRINGEGNDMVAYCFAEKPGYCRIDHYEGNNKTNGPFVYTGFRPAWIMIKHAETPAHLTGKEWYIYDYKLNPYNPAEKVVEANNDDDAIESSDFKIDILSNGFKIRTKDGGLNSHNKKFIYMAFAENPFELNGGISR